MTHNSKLGVETSVAGEKEGANSVEALVHTTDLTDEIHEFRDDTGVNDLIIGETKVDFTNFIIRSIRDKFVYIVENEVKELFNTLNT